MNRNAEKAAADKRAFMRRLTEDKDLLTGMMVFLSELNNMGDVLRMQGVVIGIHMTQVQIPEWDAEIEEQLQQIATEEGDANGDGQPTTE